MMLMFIYAFNCSDVLPSLEGPDAGDVISLSNN